MIVRNIGSRSNEMSAHHRAKSPLTISEMCMWVRDVIGSEAVIQTSDQTKWRMVLVDPKELKYPTPHIQTEPLAPIGE